MNDDSITITVLGKENVDWIRRKVSDGEYSSETEVVTEGIATLREEDTEFENWLKEVIAPRYDDHKANPSQVLTLEQLDANLEARRLVRAEKHR